MPAFLSTRTQNVDVFVSSIVPTLVAAENSLRFNCERTRRRNYRVGRLFGWSGLLLDQTRDVCCVLRRATPRAFRPSFGKHRLPLLGYSGYLDAIRAVVVERIFQLGSSSQNGIG